MSKHHVPWNLLIDTAKAAVDAALAMGELVGLVNCAGIGPPCKTVGKEGPHPLDLFTKVVQINLIGSFNMLRLAAAAMVKNAPNADGERGVIVNTASVSDAFSRGTRIATPFSFPVSSG